MPSLKPFNTFGIDVQAPDIITVEHVGQLQEALQRYGNPILPLGGGSNMLFTHDVSETILLNRIGGIAITHEDETTAEVTAGGGVVWHDLVMWAIEQQLGGIENMSLIPGTVGAAPIQNIGAYGTELKDVFVRLEAVHRADRQLYTFDKPQCQFGYRDSIFKSSHKNQYIITSVTLRLQKPPHALNTRYGDILKTLETRGVKQPNIRDISEAVVYIRQSKLPNPAELGNAGSFFKNPEIPSAQFAALQALHPDIPHYPTPDGRVKVPAGWLIEQCGWKGRRVGNTGCHARQALVLVNYGGATGLEIWEHATRVIDSVRETFGIDIINEVNVY